MARTFLAACWWCAAAAADDAAGRAGLSKPAEAFRAECAEKAAAAEKADKMTVAGRDGWVFFSGELRYVGAGRFWGLDAAKVSRAGKPEYADPLPAILDFKEQLDKLGIELLLLSVPPKAFVYPDKLTDKATGGTGAQTRAGPGAPTSPPRLDAFQREFYRLLAAKGVNVLDLTDDFLESRKLEDGNGPLYCRTDTHWSPWGCEIAAWRILREIGARKWMPGPRASPFSTQGRQIEIAGDLAAALDANNPRKEKLPARFVWVTAARDEAAVSPDRSSPVLLLGDSHVLVFNAGDDMHGTRAGLADQLAAELGFAVDLIGVRGSGATASRIELYRQAAADKDYLARKKLVIWCLAAREFTESDGWQKVPLTKPAPGAHVR